MSVRSWAVVVGSWWGRGTQKHVRPFCEETLQGHYQNVILGWLKRNSQVFSCVYVHVWVTVIRILVKRSVQAVFLLLLLLQRMQPSPGPCLQESLKYLLYASNNVKRKLFLFFVFGLFLLWLLFICLLSWLWSKSVSLCSGQYFCL